MAAARTSGRRAKIDGVLLEKVAAVFHTDGKSRTIHGVMESLDGVSKSEVNHCLYEHEHQTFTCSLGTARFESDRSRMPPLWKLVLLSSPSTSVEKEPLPKTEEEKKKSRPPIDEDKLSMELPSSAPEGVAPVRPHLLPWMEEKRIGTSTELKRVERDRPLLIAIDLGGVHDVLHKITSAHFEQFPRLHVWGFADHLCGYRKAVQDKRVQLIRFPEPGKNLADIDLALHVTLFLRDHEWFTPKLVLMSRDNGIGYTLFRVLQVRGVDVSFAASWESLQPLFHPPSSS